MKRSWLGVALLSLASAFAYPLYHRPDPVLFVVFATAGVALQFGLRCVLPRGRTALIGAVLVMPAIAWLAWPFNASPLCLCLGLFLRAWSGRAGASGWRDRIACALSGSGAMLGAQALALEAFAGATAVAREIPGPLACVLAGLANLVGAEAGVAGGGISLFTMRQVHVLAATWELALDPVLVCFLVGGVVLIALESRGGSAGWRGAVGHAGFLCLVILAWVPLRFCVNQGLFLHRALQTGYDTPLTLMNQYWSPWVFFALLMPPLALVLWRVQRPSPEVEVPGARRDASAGSGATILAASFCSAALFCFGFYWDPPGVRKAGRVVVDEYHSDWERTDRPFGTDWYGQDSTYNYAAIFDYTGRFFDTAQIVEPLTPEVLSEADVLILKIPTRPFEAEEIESILRFVEGGGGLFLVGEHTDVFRSGTFLNEIARPLGVEFRSDCLLHIDSVFSQEFNRPRVPHPIVRHAPWFRFQVSCSLVPRSGDGRCVIVSPGLRALSADYNMSNYYPEVRDYTDVRYGAFVQMWACRRGRGRVVAFTDSTIFSNFSAFEPGVSELWLGAIDWLNRRDGVTAPRSILWVFGLLVAGLGIGVGVRRREGTWATVAAAALCGWAISGMAVNAAHAAGARFPKAVRPFVRVNVDRRISRVPLTEAGFLGDHESSFGIFEMWVLRLGYFTRRCFGNEAFDGDLLLVLHPEGKVPPGYMRRLSEYVRGGGALMVLDSERNTTSTSNEILSPFGLSIDRAKAVEGIVEPAGGFAKHDGVVAGGGFCVTGGRPILVVGGVPVGAVASFGKGTVAALGCGGIFDDDVMGGYFHAQPDGDLPARYGLEFDLLRGLVEGRFSWKRSAEE